MAKSNQKTVGEGDVERMSYNGQKPRTEDEQLQALRRRLRRWHRKAVNSLGVDTIRTLLVEAEGYDQAETANDK